ncbi:MAG: caspase family protein [Pseudomonadota bacterium]
MLLRALISIFFLFVAMAQAQAQVDNRKRIALVVGNSAYDHMRFLPNPINDAKLMRDSLEEVGFEVYLEYNATEEILESAFSAHGQRLAQAVKAGEDPIGLVYFAGHGVQLNGLNFLLPVDAEIYADADVFREAPRLADLFSQLAIAGNSTNFVVLDACRNNRLPSAFRGEKGLASEARTRGTLIAYSTQPGATAADGGGANSPYTEALAKWITQAGLASESMFRHVATEVERVTGGVQQPWIDSGLRGKDFCFAGCDGSPDLFLGELGALPSTTPSSPRATSQQERNEAPPPAGNSIRYGDALSSDLIGLELFNKVNQARERFNEARGMIALGNRLMDAASDAALVAMQDSSAGCELFGDGYARIYNPQEKLWWLGKVTENTRDCGPSGFGVFTDSEQSSSASFAAYSYQGLMMNLDNIFQESPKSIEVDFKSITVVDDFSDWSESNRVVRVYQRDEIVSNDFSSGEIQRRFVATLYKESDCVERGLGYLEGDLDSGVFQGRVHFNSGHIFEGDIMADDGGFIKRTGLVWGPSGSLEGREIDVYSSIVANCSLETGELQ